MNKIFVVGLIFTMWFVLAGASYSQETHKKNVLTMGRFSDKAFKEQKQIMPIITYLASKLKDMGIEQGDVVLVHNNEDVIEYLKEGKLDIVLEAPFSAYQYKFKTNAIPILSAWRKGAGEYSSVIFVRKDSGIQQVEDLKGRVFAFEDPGSTSSYFLPKYTLKAKGLDMVGIDSSDSLVPEGKTGYVFAGSELNISNWVFFNKVDAGALSNSDWADQKDNPEAYRKEFKIIYETLKVPRMLLVVREGINKKLLERIKEELLKMDKSKEGRDALKSFKVKKFTELSEGSLGHIDNLLRKVSSEELY